LVLGTFPGAAKALHLNALHARPAGEEVIDEQAIESIPDLVRGVSPHLLELNLESGCLVLL